MYRRRKVNSPTSTTAPVSPSFESLISSFSTLWSLNHVWPIFRPGSDFVYQTTLWDRIRLHCVKRSRASFEQTEPLLTWELVDSSRRLLPIDIATCLDIINSICLYNVTAFIAGFLAAALFTRCLELQSVPVFTCQSRLQGKPSAGTLPRGFSHRQYAAAQHNYQQANTRSMLINLTIRQRQSPTAHFNTGVDLTFLRVPQLKTRVNMSAVSFCGFESYWAVTPPRLHSHLIQPLKHTCRTHTYAHSLALCIIQQVSNYIWT